LVEPQSKSAGGTADDSGDVPIAVLAGRGQQHGLEPLPLADIVGGFEALLQLGLHARLDGQFKMSTWHGLVCQISPIIANLLFRLFKRIGMNLRYAIYDLRILPQFMRAA
jgi:hypothetical protein